MPQPKPGFLCYAGLAKLALSGLLATLAALGSFAEWWSRDDTLSLIALALAVGTGGHALVQTHCCIPSKRP